MVEGSLSLQDRSGADFRGSDELLSCDRAAEAAQQRMVNDAFQVRALLCALTVTPLTLRGKGGRGTLPLRAFSPRAKKKAPGKYPFVKVCFAGSEKEGKKNSNHINTASLSLTHQATNDGSGSAEGPSSDLDSNQDGDGAGEPKQGDTQVDACEVEARLAQKSGRLVKRNNEVSAR